MLENDIVKDINLTVYDTLKNSPLLRYCKTISNGFYPREENLIAPSQFPAIILEFGTISGLSNPRTQIFEYIYIQPIVCITLADKGNFNDLVFNVSNINANKGIGDMIYDVRKVLWQYHATNFGIENVISWKFGSTHIPNVLNIQRLLSSIFIRGLQIDLEFQIWERI